MNTASPTLIAAIAVSAAPAASDELIAVPSGREVRLQEAIGATPGPAGLTARFRFISPDIARNDTDAAIDETLFEDMAWLCESYALPRLSNIGPQVEQIIISLADRAVEFGETDPDVTQFFEAYRPENGFCVWEGF